MVLDMRAAQRVAGTGRAAVLGPHGTADVTNGVDVRNPVWYAAQCGP